MYTLLISNSGQNFVDNCKKAGAVMDDVLPGVIIEGVLGVEITHIPELTDQTYFTPPSDFAWYRHQVHNTFGICLVSLD